METLDRLGALFAYDGWATRALLECMRGLNEEQWDAPMAGTGASPFGLARHLLAAMDNWCVSMAAGHRVRAEVPELACVDDLLVYDEQVRGRLDGVLATMTPERLAAEFAPEYGHGLTYDLALRHLANHGTYHRGQLALALTACGIECPDTDLLFWAWGG